MLGPATFDTMLPTLELPQSLANYMKEVMAVCDGTLVKAAALQGRSEEYWGEHHEPNRNMAVV